MPQNRKLTKAEVELLETSGIHRVTKARKEEMKKIYPNATINTRKHYVQYLKKYNLKRKRELQRKAVIKNRKDLKISRLGHYYKLFNRKVKNIMRSATTKNQKKALIKVEAEKKKLQNFKWLRKTFWKHRGKRVNIVYRSDDNGTQRDLIANIPYHPVAFTKWFDTEKWSWVTSQDFIWDADIQQSGKWNVKGRLKIYKPAHIPPHMVFQRFKDGGGCFLNPIMEWAEEKLNNTENKQARWRYNKIINYCKTFETEFGSMPENEIQEFADACKLNIHVYPPFTDKPKHAKIYKCKGQNIKVFTFYNTREDHVETVRPLANTIMMKDCNELSKEYDKLKSDFTHKKEPILFFGQSHRVHKIIQGENVYIINEKEDTREIITEMLKGFYKDNSFFWINGVADKYGDNRNLSNYLKDSCRYMACIDIKKGWVDGKKVKNLQHIDMKKGYTQFKQTPYYDGFVGKFQEFRRCDQICGLGIYTIVNIKCLSPFAYWLNKKLNILGNFVSYTSPFLKFMKDIGFDFEIIGGAWGNKKDLEFTDEVLNTKNAQGLPLYSHFVGKCDRQVYEGTFRMYGSKTHLLALQRSYNSIDDDNESEIFLDCSHNGVGAYHYKLDRMYHNSGFTSFIVAYQACNVIEQLKKLWYDYEVLRVNGDGIFYNGDKINDDLLGGGFRNKNDWTTLNEGGDSYFSGVSYDWFNAMIKRLGRNDKNISLTGNGFYIEEGFLCSKNSKKSKPLKLTWNWNKKMKNRKKWCFEAWKRYKNRKNKYCNQYQMGGRRKYFDGIEAHMGPPGCGKTTALLGCRGFVNVAFVANGWLLVADKCDEYKFLTAEVNNVFRSQNRKRTFNFFKNINVIIVDEGSMVDQELFEIMKEKCEEYSIKLIMCGDWGFQLPPANNKPEMSVEGLNLVEYKYIIGKCRFQKKEHRKGGLVTVLNKIRNVIALCNDYHNGKRCLCNEELRKYVIKWGRKNNLNVCANDVKGIIEKDDRIVCWTNAEADKWTNLMKEGNVNRYKVMTKIKGYYTGSVVWGTEEEVHACFGQNILLKYADTIHSLQGITAPSKVYVDINTMRCKEILTSLSRVRKKEDLRIIN
mgnify:CR=1 FL=1